MVQGIAAIAVLGVAVLFIKLSALRKQVKEMQIQIDSLCKETGNQQLATYFLFDNDKANILAYKSYGYDADAVKKVREMTAMDVVEAKHFVDSL